VAEIIHAQQKNQNLEVDQNSADIHSLSNHQQNTVISFRFLHCLCPFERYVSIELVSKLHVHTITYAYQYLHLYVILEMLPFTVEIIAPVERASIEGEILRLHQAGHGMHIDLVIASKSEDFDPLLNFVARATESQDVNAIEVAPNVQANKINQQRETGVSAGKPDAMFYGIVVLIVALMIIFRALH